MKKIILVLILVLTCGLISHCDFGLPDDDDDPKCSNMRFPQICNFEFDSLTSNNRYATITMVVYCVGPDGVGSEYNCESHITNYRVGFLRMDDKEGVPPEMDRYTNIYIPTDERISFSILVYSNEQFEDIETPFSGYAYIQFWGKYIDDSDFYTETRIAVYFDHGIDLAEFHSGQDN